MFTVTKHELPIGHYRVALDTPLGVRWMSIPIAWDIGTTAQAVLEVYSSPLHRPQTQEEIYATFAQAAQTREARDTKDPLLNIRSALRITFSTETELEAINRIMVEAQTLRRDIAIANSNEYNARRKLEAYEAKIAGTPEEKMRQDVDTLVKERDHFRALAETKYGFNAGAKGTEFEQLKAKCAEQGKDILAYRKHLGAVEDALPTQGYHPYSELGAAVSRLMAEHKARCGVLDQLIPMFPAKLSYDELPFAVSSIIEECGRLKTVVDLVQKAIASVKIQLAAEVKQDQHVDPYWALAQAAAAKVEADDHARK